MGKISACWVEADGGLLLITPYPRKEMEEKRPIGKFYIMAGEGEETRIREKEKKERRERRWTAGG